MLNALSVRQSVREPTKTNSLPDVRAKTYASGTGRRRVGRLIAIMTFHAVLEALEPLEATHR